MAVQTVSAEVLRLPTADLPPVQQEGRRGRHPKAIAVLWNARTQHEKRSRTARLFQLHAALDHAQQARSEAFQRVLDATAAVRQAESELDALAKLQATIQAEIQALT